MSKRKAGLLVIGVLLAVGLTGCGETLAERVQNRTECEAAGGIYTERTSAATYDYSGWNCDLSTKEATS